MKTRSSAYRYFQGTQSGARLTRLQVLNIDDADDNYLVIPMSHLLTQESWLTRAFCTSGSKKVVCSCLQDLDLLFEWHMKFSPFFKRTTTKHTARMRERRACSDAIKEASWDVS